MLDIKVTELQRPVFPHVSTPESKWYKPNIHSPMTMTWLHWLLVAGPPMKWVQPPKWSGWRLKRNMLDDINYALITTGLFPLNILWLAICFCLTCGFSEQLTSNTAVFQTYLLSSPSAALLLLYDVTNKASFDNIRVRTATLVCHFPSLHSRLRCCVFWKMTHLKVFFKKHEHPWVRSEQLQGFQGSSCLVHR